MSNNTGDEEDEVETVGISFRNVPLHEKEKFKKGTKMSKKLREYIERDNEMMEDEMDFSNSMERKSLVILKTYRSAIQNHIEVMKNQRDKIDERIEEFKPENDEDDEVMVEVRIDTDSLDV